MWHGVILLDWHALAGCVALLREAFAAPAIWENFEYVAALSQRYKDQHPSDVFPRHVPRMPVDTSLLRDFVETKNHATGERRRSQRLRRHIA
ncbi:MAG: hypothetical protein GIW95_01635 [Candidatus Eremiobacteraeota bacterium]|nr:hypothetical protein [Candidatus Eremiobacteraeota bacterium]